MKWIQFVMGARGSEIWAFNSQSLIIHISF